MPDQVEQAATDLLVAPGGFLDGDPTIERARHFTRASVRTETEDAVSVDGSAVRKGSTDLAWSAY